MMPKKLIPEYELLKEYAEGGQSYTLLVQKESTKYIIKVPKSSTLSKERKFRLEREIKALELMNGKGVPKLLDYSLEDEVYIIMEYVEGLTLDKYLSKYSLDPEQSVNLVISLSDIIEHAHQIGLFHRDLKPDNIIISEKNGEPIIIDFGICWLSDDGSFKTKKGVELGNRFLRLPELSKGTDVTVSTSDITFLIGLLFFILTKNQPHILLNENGQMPHQRDDIKSIEILSNKKLKEIFDKGFTYEVALRYQTADELQQDLKKIFLPNPSMKSNNITDKLDELFNSDFHKKRSQSIDLITNYHREFLSTYRKTIHNSLAYGGSGPSYRESDRIIQTRMFLIQENATEPLVWFFFRITI